jgi:hypothetical protein
MALLAAGVLSCYERRDEIKINTPRLNQEKDRAALPRLPSLHDARSSSNLPSREAKA